MYKSQEIVEILKTRVFFLYFIASKISWDF